VDYLASQADVVARYNGGDNAGHTVTVGPQTFKLHLIPSGIIHAQTIGVMGNGMVIFPATLLSEIEMLRSAGIKVDPSRLCISFAAHLITPAHRALDAAQEKARGQGQIGTTGRGIGPAYTDKTARRGLRMQDMLDPQAFHQKMLAHVQDVNHQLMALYHADPLDAEAMAQQYDEYARVLSPYIGDGGALVWKTLQKGGRVLAEGGQGTLLDLDHGTYPFVTSSTPTAAGAFVGLGVGVTRDVRVVGITKAFQTRVGAGPFPTEVFGDEATLLRGTGSKPWDEFGTTTGRPRRVGWLDGVLLRYAARINGLSEIFLTKMDVLSGFDEIWLCTAYRAGGKEYEELPMGPADLAPFEPVYETLPGWKEDISAVRDWKQLPLSAQRYIRRIEEICGVPVSEVSVGPEREQVVKVTR
jgi:adenylosuccinate synthase